MAGDTDTTFRNIPWYKEFLERMSPRRMEPVGATPERVLDNIVSAVAEHKANADAHATRR